jgi:ESCRT-I complex subunit TSG101
LEESELKPSPPIDEVVTPADAPSSQMFELVAEDAAVEDTMYVLTRALENGSIDLEGYLKLYRSLCREQFMKVATCKRIFEVQLQIR